MQNSPYYEFLCGEIYKEKNTTKILFLIIKVDSVERKTVNPSKEDKYINAGKRITMLE